MGARLGKVDGPAKLTGRERYGADGIPADALWLKVLRSPHAAAAFTLGDTSQLRARHPGLVRVLTAADVPVNGFGIYPHLKDQPVLAEGIARYRGEAIAAFLGERAAIDAIRQADVPIAWRPGEPVLGLDAAMAKGAAPVQADRSDNLLIEGRVVRAIRTRLWPDAPPSRAAPSARRSSSTPTSSPRRAGRGAAALAPRCMSPPRPRTWTATRSPTCWASHPSGSASCRAPAAAASAASSISRCSRCSRSPPA